VGITDSKNRLAARRQKAVEADGRAWSCRVTAVHLARGDVPRAPSSLRDPPAVSGCGRCLTAVRWAGDATCAPLKGLSHLTFMSTSRPGWAWVFSLLLACGGGSKTTCQQAHDKLDQCQPQINAAAARRGLRVPLSLSDDCSGDDECVAACLAPAGCGAIVVLSAGSSTDPNDPRLDAPDAGTLFNCFSACTKR